MSSTRKLAMRLRLRSRVALVRGLCWLALIAHSPMVAARPAVCTDWQVMDPTIGFPSQLVFDVVLDGEVVWAGTAAGVARSTGETWQVYAEPQGLPSSLAWALALAPSGDLYVATPRGLVRLTGGRVDVFQVNNSGLPADAVYDVAVQDRSVWLATAGGLGRLDLRSGSWSIWSPENAPLPVATLSRVLPTPHGLWVATFGGGLLFFDPARNEWSIRKDPDHDPRRDLRADDGLLQNAPTALALGSRPDELWIGFEQGLTVLRQDRFQDQLPNRQSGAIWPASPHVLSLAAAGDLLFVGTDRGLAVRRDAVGAGEWTIYQPADSVTKSAQISQAATPPVPLTGQGGATTGPILGVALGQRDIWLATTQGLAHCRAAAEPGPPSAIAATETRLVPSTTPTDPTPTLGEPLDLMNLEPPPVALHPGGLSVTTRAVRIGLVLPAKESLAARSLEAGMQLALEQLPADSGHGPRQLPWVLEPMALAAQPWPGLAAQVGLRLAEREVRLVIVPPGLFAGQELELAQVARQTGLPLLLVGSGEPELPGPAHPWLLHQGWPVRLQLRALVQRLKTRTIQRIVLVHDESRYGQAGAEAFAAEARARQLPLVGTALHARGQTLAATVQEVVRLQPDTLLFWAEPRVAGELLRGIRAAGLRASCLGPAGLDAPEFFATAGELAEGCTLAQALHVQPGPALETFAALFAKRFTRQPDPWAALGYELTHWIIRTLSPVVELERSHVMETLRQTMPSWKPELVLPHGDGRGGIPLGVVRNGQVVVGTSAPR